MRDCRAKVRITVMRKSCYSDLVEKYENPTEHAVFLSQYPLATPGSTGVFVVRSMSYYNHIIRHWGRPYAFILFKQQLRQFWY